MKVLKNVIVSLLALFIVGVCNQNVYAGPWGDDEVYTADGEYSWKKNQTGWWLEKKDGTWASNKWMLIDGKTYYFNNDGYMATGWLQWLGEWYYIDQDGNKYVGWLKDNGNLYYLQENGVMRTYKMLLDSVIYSFDENGVLFNEHVLGGN